MNGDYKKRRTSILKKSQFTEDEPTEITMNKYPRRSQIQFSQKNQVKEFVQCEDNVTIWGNTYETSVAKSDGSSDGSSTSRKMSVDFTHSATTIIESEKENASVPKGTSEEQRSSTGNVSSASNSIEMTIDMNTSERRRLNKYGGDNLNITNMPLDSSPIINKFLSVPGKSEKVLSPRKMIFINKQSNMSVVVQDKVYMNPSELDDNVSVSIEDDEKMEFLKNNPHRKTTNQPVDMNITVEKKQQDTPQKPYSSVSKEQQKAFKFPELPKFKIHLSSFDSPPLKPPVIENQKQENDELFEMMVSDTPSKNLCCLGKSCTPNKSAQKVIFSTIRPSTLRKSADIFKEIGLIEDDDEPNKLHTARRTIFHDDSMKFEVNTEKRKTTFDKVKMDETLKEKESPITAEKMEETRIEKSSNKFVFDLEDDVSVARNVPVMKMAPADYNFEKSMHKRSTLSNDNCNVTNFVMELTNIDDTYASLETTAKLNRAADKILKNPNATLGSSSILNSPFPEEFTDLIPRCPMQAHKSLILEPAMHADLSQKSASINKNRMTTFKEDDMEVSGIGPMVDENQKLETEGEEISKMSRRNMAFENVEAEKSLKNRTTTYNLNQMDMTAVESNHLEHATTSSLRISKQYEMHISPKEFARIKRESTENTQSQARPIEEGRSFRKRATVYSEDKMNTSTTESPEKIPKVLTQRSRETMFGDESIKIYMDDRQNEASEKISELSKKRVTTFNISNMDVTGIEENLTEKVENHLVSSHRDYYRMTTYANQMEVTKQEDFQEATGSFPTRSSVMGLDFDASLGKNKNRTTTFNINNMDMTGDETLIKSSSENVRQESPAKEDQVSGPSSSAALSQINSKRVTTYANQMDISVNEIEEICYMRANPIVRNIQNMSIEEQDGVTLKEKENRRTHFDPSIIFESPVYVISSDTEASISPMPKKRATTHVKHNINLSIDENRQTTYKMDMSGIETATGNADDDRRKTFKVPKTRESLKWHDITDTHLLNMIENESNPCLQDVSSSNRISSEQTNISKHEEAIEDFMNFTVRASPLNQSVLPETSFKKRRQSRVPSPVRDYDCEFDKMVQNLKEKKEANQPLLEIDKYLEEMKIDPIKFPQHPQNQEGYLEDKLNELILKHATKREEKRKHRKEIDAAQLLPQIPSALFLIKNLFESVEEEAKKAAKMNRQIIPIFPAPIDFETLLKNKFRTDEHLSKYWLYSAVFWHLGEFKLTHRKCPMFTLNIKCQQSMLETYKSTIPIIFKQVLLYVNPEHRKPCSKTRKNTVLQKEFHRAVNGVDNFTSMCMDSSQLFDFLDYYHMNVMKANEVVDNFFTILTNYTAIYKLHPEQGYETVLKRCFLAEDIVDIEISLHRYLEDVTLEKLSIEGNNFTYTLKPQENVAEMKGLMLIELILFDTEKFLQNNTIKIEIEDD